MPGQHRRHVVVVDPAHPLGGVGGGREVGGEEPVALQAPRRHEDEDPERGVAEPEPGWRRLGVQAHREVDVLDRVVHRGQLRRGRRILGEVVEGPGRRQRQQPAELVVAGDAALPGAQDVHGREVNLHAVLAAEPLHEPGMVVQGHGAGMLRGEGVEQVGRTHASQHLARAQTRCVQELDLLDAVRIGDRPHRQVVRRERVHPVDRHELLGDRVRRGVVVRGRAGDAADDLAAADPAEQSVDPLLGEAEPVGAHADLQCGVAEDRGRPLDGVDLRDQGSDHQAGLVEHLVVAPRRVGRMQHVADGVVLAHEQRVQQLEANPPAVQAAGAAEHGRVDVDQAVRADRDLARAQLPTADRALELGSGAVDLGGVPPVRLGVDERARRIALGVRVVGGAGQQDRVRGPGVAGRAGHREGALDVRAVAEPVARLELQPRGGDDVERRRRDHLLAPRQQRRAHQPRVGCHQPRALLGLGEPQRHVAPEPGACHAHRRQPQVVVRAVDGAGDQHAGRRLGVELRRRYVVVRVVQVPGPHRGADAQDQGECDRHREAVPAAALIDFDGEHREPAAEGVHRASSGDIRAR